MSSPPIDTVLENQSLKKEFSLRNLDLSQIWQPTPDDLELENRQLRHLLDWVENVPIVKNWRPRATYFHLSVLILIRTGIGTVFCAGSVVYLFVKL